MDKRIIARNFSRCAHLYDKYAGIQRLVAEQLIKELPADGITDILEIGCGTGIYTGYLKNRYATARINALDISSRMIEIARRKICGDDINFIVADAELTYMKGQFDLITSNAAFQWFENIGFAVERYKEALAAGGMFIFSIFGKTTFRELKYALKSSSGRQILISSDDFLNREDVGRVLRRSFRKFSIKELLLKEEHPSLMKLLKSIKYTGVRGGGAIDKVAFNKGMLRRIEENYRSNFGAITATYQIFFCKATI